MPDITWRPPVRPDFDEAGRQIRPEPNRTFRMLIILAAGMIAIFTIAPRLKVTTEPPKVRHTYLQCFNKISSGAKAEILPNNSVSLKKEMFEHIDQCTISVEEK